MRPVLSILFATVVVWGEHALIKHWQQGKNLENYLKEHHIPKTLLKGLSKEDRSYLARINTDLFYIEVVDSEEKLKHALIPISESLQISLFRNDGNYSFEIIPVEAEIKEYFAKVVIEQNLYQDTLNQIGLKRLADKISLLFKGVFDGTKLHKGDEVYFVYEQATRLGIAFGAPSIKVACIVRQGKKPFYIYGDNNGRGSLSTNQKVAFTQKKKKRITKTKRIQKLKRFIYPLRRVRITSHFAYRRWHPILKRYKPHRGTDFGAKHGTPLLAVNDGVVVFVGWKGSYGKTVIIRHGGGYESLYAHQSRYRVRKGQKVKQGQIIGYVGSTGRSTGPHLHFEIIKHGRRINPLKVLGKKSLRSLYEVKKFVTYKDVKVTRYKMVPIEGAKEAKRKLDRFIKEGGVIKQWVEHPKLYEKVIIDEEKVI